MSAYYDSAKGRWRFEFTKVIGGVRIRTSKTLPKGWDRAKAEAFSQQETARLYAAATGTVKERISIEAAVEKYYVHQCPKLKNGDGVRKELARLHGYYAGRYVDEISEVAREYVEAERDRLAPATMKNKLSYLRAACRYAAKHYGMGDGSVIIAMPAVSNERQSYVTRREMVSIALACKDRHARALIRLGFYTGMRLGEMMTLGNESKILDGAFYLPPAITKNKMGRMVPIHPKIAVVCRFLPLPYKKRWMQRVIRQVMDSAGYAGLHFHDLRHSSASAMINSGVDLYTVGKVLGHKDQRSTQRYSHLSIETLTAAVRKIK